MKIKQKQERIEKTNQLLEVIAGCGRNFFRSEKFNRTSHFQLEFNGRLYFHDKYTDVLLPLSHMYSKRWSVKFSDGGTLKSLVELLARYIKTGKQISPNIFGPWPEWICDGDPWGYGKDMEKIRLSATELGISNTPKNDQFNDIEKGKGNGNLSSGNRQK